MARSLYLMDYEEGTIKSLSFRIDTAHGEMGVKLPINAQAVLKVLEGQGVPLRYANYEQAVKIAWRILKDWVRAQMAILETEMVTMEQVFLPYILTKNNRTLYETMVKSNFQLTQGGQEK